MKVHEDSTHEKHQIGDVHQGERHDPINYSLHTPLGLNSQRSYSSCFDELTVHGLVDSCRDEIVVLLHSTKCQVLHYVKASVGHERVERLMLV